jgi:hypothetical protein
MFKRRRPLHERLAEAGGISLDGASGSGAAHPPGWDGNPVPYGEVGIHGVARPRRWDVVASADAPRVRGEAVHFVALPDGTLVVDEDERDDALAPLAEAVEQTITPPYRAEAVRRSADAWAVAAVGIRVVEARNVDGNDVELTSRGGTRTLAVDGRPRPGRIPALERAGETAGSDYVVRARRLDGDLWEVDATPF